MDRLLDVLAGHEVTGTFFILGWLAEQEPEMVRRCSEAGHEIASHGYEHELVGELGPDGFRESVRRSRAILQDLTGRDVIGYRAPSFSIVPGLEWAFDTLLEEGLSLRCKSVPDHPAPDVRLPELAAGSTLD